MNRPSLYQLQASWDDERARARIAALRASLAPRQARDRRWMPLALVLIAIALTGLAALGPA